MISFKDLNESLNAGYEFDIDNIDGTGSSVQYDMSFDGKNSRYFVMVLADLKRKIIRIDFSDDEGSNDATGIAGMDAIKVFATLGNILHKALIQHQGFAVQFEGAVAEPSKVKAYRALAKRVSTFTHGKVTENRIGPNIRFTIG
ncbi:hypothetical protein EVB91_015 [Rhizobium phage RHph_I1_18]|nr:hypothetical protein EVB91_015 [Rhizobium phage RHph_I1_18]